MIFDKILGIFRRPEDIRTTLPYRLAEQIISEAMRRGTKSLNIKGWPKETFLAGKNDLTDLVEEEPDAPIQFREGNYVLGVSLRGNGKDRPYLSLPRGLFLPLLNILASEKIAYKGKKCFALYDETSSRKKIDKYIDLTLYWENDSSLSIDFEEIK